MSNPSVNSLSIEQLTKQEELHHAIHAFERAIPLLESQPVINRVLVLPIPLTATTKAGLIIPDSARERPEIGTVIATGPGRTLDNGVHIQCVVNIGDRVQYGKYSGTFVYDEQLDVELLLMIDADCLTAKPQPQLLQTNP